MQRARAWCFTLNNPTQQEQEALSTSLKELSAISYAVYGEETGDNGTFHLQGYVEFVNRKTMSAAKSFLGTTRLHLEKRKGNAQQAAEYCKKDGAFKEYGTLSSQGYPPLVWLILNL